MSKVSPAVGKEQSPVGLGLFSPDGVVCVAPRFAMEEKGFLVTRAVAGKEKAFLVTRAVAGRTAAGAA